MIFKTDEAGHAWVKERWPKATVEEVERWWSPLGIYDPDTAFEVVLESEVVGWMMCGGGGDNPDFWHAKPACTVTYHSETDPEWREGD